MLWEAISHAGFAVHGMDTGRAIVRVTGLPAAGILHRCCDIGTHLSLSVLVESGAGDGRRLLRGLHAAMVLWHAFKYTAPWRYQRVLQGRVTSALDRVDAMAYVLSALCLVRNQLSRPSVKHAGKTDEEETNGGDDDDSEIESGTTGIASTCALALHIYMLYTRRRHKIV